MKVRLALLVLVALALIGCGGGGDSGPGANFTLNIQWPAFDAASANALAKAKSVGVAVTKGSDQLWAGVVERPSDSGGNTTTRMALSGSGAVTLELRARSEHDYQGTLVGQTDISTNVGATQNVSSF